MRTTLVLVLLMAAGCGSDGRRVGGPGGGGDVDLLYGGGNDDAGAGTDDGSVDPGMGDNNCHEENFAPTKVGDPDIILLQDISGSMADGMPTKYSQVTGALSSVLTNLEQQMSPIEWGMYFFPSDGACGVNQNPDVPLGKMNAQPIVQKLQANMPNGNTPTHKAVMNAAAYYGGINDGRGHYLLLATDGEPNCDDGGGLPMTCMKNADCPMGQTCQMVPFIGGICVSTGGAAIMAIDAARQAGIKTFVVGIDLGGDSQTLNDMATAGGTARPGPTKYYAVSDQMSLETALTNITSQIISCSFALMSLPDQNQMIEVTVGGQKIPRDMTHMNGWDIDPNTKTLTFYGDACTALQTNPGVVKVGYTCPPPG